MPHPNQSLNFTISTNFHLISIFNFSFHGGGRKEGSLSKKLVDWWFLILRCPFIRQLEIQLILISLPNEGIKDESLESFSATMLDAFYHSTLHLKFNFIPSHPHYTHTPLSSSSCSLSIANSPYNKWDEDLNSLNILCEMNCLSFIRSFYTNSHSLSFSLSLSMSG